MIKNLFGLSDQYDDTFYIRSKHSYSALHLHGIHSDFLHDKLDKVGKVPLQLVKLVNFAMRFFIRVPANFNLWGERKHKLPVNLAKRY